MVVSTVLLSRIAVSCEAVVAGGRVLNLKNIRGDMDRIEMHDKNHAKQMLTRRILFAQCTDPSAYPPLERSSRRRANRGWNVDFLGTSARGIDNLRFPIHPRIRVKKLRFMTSGWRQKLQ